MQYVVFVLSRVNLHVLWYCASNNNRHIRLAFTTYDLNVVHSNVMSFLAPKSNLANGIHHKWNFDGQPEKYWLHMLLKLKTLFAEFVVDEFSKSHQASGLFISIQQHLKGGKIKCWSDMWGKELWTFCQAFTQKDAVLTARDQTADINLMGNYFRIKDILSSVWALRYCRNV